MKLPVTTTLWSVCLCVTLLRRRSRRLQRLPDSEWDSASQCIVSGLWQCGHNTTLLLLLLLLRLQLRTVSTPRHRVCRRLRWNLQLPVYTHGSLIYEIPVSLNLYPAPGRYRERGIVLARFLSFFLPFFLSFFLSLFVCLFVSLYLCFFVSKITRKRLDRFAWNFQGRCGVTMGRPHSILGQFGWTGRPKTPKTPK